MSKITWLDGDRFDSYDELLDHLWLIDECKLPDKEGLWTFYGGKFAKENLIELLQAIVAQVNQSYRFLEQSINEYNTVNKISEIVDRDLTSLDDPWDMLSQVSKAILECKSRRGSVASKQTNDKGGVSIWETN